MNKQELDAAMADLVAYEEKIRAVAGKLTKGKWLTRVRFLQRITARLKYRHATLTSDVDLA